MNTKEIEPERLVRIFEAWTQSIETFPESVLKGVKITRRIGKVVIENFGSNLGWLRLVQSADGSNSILGLELHPSRETASAECPDGPHPEMIAVAWYEPPSYYNKGSFFKRRCNESVIKEGTEAEHVWEFLTYFPFDM